MTQPKKLIEVAMPIKEISAESVRDKSIRHGHISTLHLWWARRPLPVCRAVVFASLIPDPLDENCPQSFKDAVEILLGSSKNPLNEQDIDSSAYKPYDEMPYTAAHDKMGDTLRNRLLMFIGKYSIEFCNNEKAGKITASGNQLSNYSLIKWDNKNNDLVINKARKLIWVAYNSRNNKLSAIELINDFDKHYKAIKDAENELYSHTDRHVEDENSKHKIHKLNTSIETFLDRMPKVFDPFAGGGAIPLEAARLGCRSFGNDINPVAHIIQKGSLEFPQKYGKPITYSKSEFLKLYGKEEWNKITNDNLVFEKGEAIAVKIANRLSFDVEFYARKLLNEAEKEIGHLYPTDEKGKRPIAYYWARVGNCSNPSCKAEVPLLKGFYLANTKTKQVYLKPNIKDKKIDFEIEHGNCTEEGWMTRGNLKCPVCGNTTDVKTLKQQFINGKTKEQLLAVIWEGEKGKVYKKPSIKDIEVIQDEKLLISRPSEPMPVLYTQALPSCTWGFTRWTDMFSVRQFFALNYLVNKLNDYKKDFSENEYSTALTTYLAILIDKWADYNSSFCTWHVSGEKIGHVFGKQAIPMVLDFPEVSITSRSSGSINNMMEWILRYIDSESSNTFWTTLQNSSSGDKYQFDDKYLTAVVTDPPYYDAIAYADLSDFFYVWLKRTLGDVFPLNFATPQTPKGDECTALKHHHNGDTNIAKEHFEIKLTQIFDAIEHQTSDIVSIMFAHQSTEAWTTLCNSILGARMNITGSWAIDTELANRSLGLAGSVLASSVTVSCKPSQKSGYGDYKEVKRAIEKKVAEEVDELYRLGFRGADLLTACFGQAVSEFGRYAKVEKADGTEVTVAELLEMAKESAFNALLKGFDGDDFTKFYIGWLQLYGLAESDFDDAAKFSRVGLSINVSDLFGENILIQHGNKQTLGTFEQRIEANKNLGERATNNIIDLVHRGMALYKGSNRKALLEYIDKVAGQPENSFWRVITSLCEVLPNGSDDFKQAIGLITNKDSLIKESKNVSKSVSEQAKLEF